MRGSKREGRRPGTWELRVDAGRDPLTGSRQQKSVIFEGGSREADVALAELITKASRGGVSVGTGTVADAVEAGYSRSTVRSCHILVCRVLDQAQRWGWVAVNVGRDARPPRQTGANPKPVPVDVMLTMLDAAAGTNPTLATLIVLAADTGARRGELCALRWRHVDFEARTLRIEAAIGETNVIYEKDTKNHQHRTVTLSEFAAEWLHEHWTRHAKACALCGTDLSEDAYVLAPEPGGLTPWDPSNATRAFGRLRDRLELPTWVHLHGLRHLQVTQLLDAGIPLRSVSGRVGHLNMTTTGNIYAHVSLDGEPRIETVLEQSRPEAHPAERRRRSARSPDGCSPAASIRATSAMNSGSFAMASATAAAGSVPSLTARSIRCRVISPRNAFSATCGASSPNSATNSRTTSSDRSTVLTSSRVRPRSPTLACIADGTPARRARSARRVRSLRGTNPLANVHGIEALAEMVCGHWRASDRPHSIVVPAPGWVVIQRGQEVAQTGLFHRRTKLTPALALRAETTMVRDHTIDEDGTVFVCPVCNFEGLTVAPYETWPPPPDTALHPPYEDALGRPSYEVRPLCEFEFGNDDNRVEGDQGDAEASARIRVRGSSMRALAHDLAGFGTWVTIDEPIELREMLGDIGEELVRTYRS